MLTVHATNFHGMAVTMVAGNKQKPASNNELAIFIEDQDFQLTTPPCLRYEQP